MSKPLKTVFLLITFLRYRTFTSVFKYKKAKRISNIVAIKIFLTVLFLLVDARTRTRTNNDGSGSGRSINIRLLRIRIHNTGFNKIYKKTYSIDAKIIGGIHEVLLVVCQVKSFLFAGRPTTV
jgi:hypothetical protein